MDELKVLHTDRTIYVINTMEDEGKCWDPMLAKTSVPQIHTSNP